MKRPTRYKAEFVNAAGEVVCDMLLHDFPDPRFVAAMAEEGYYFRRASVPSTTGEAPLVYSEHDPAESIAAAIEHAGRRDTQVGNVLMLLIANLGEWVSRDAIRRAGGDSGDRRVRELRKRNWPIEVRQLAPGEAWHCRLVLPSDVLRQLRVAS